MIRFNVPYLSGKELSYIGDVFQKGHLSGDGFYTRLCSEFFKDRYGFRHNFLTTSGTDALEMTALLSNVSYEDEVIIPSFTFVSTANAFCLRGAKIVFADSMNEHPNIDHNHIEGLITKKTKAIVVMHYGGVACEMNTIKALASKYNLFLIEDAAHAIDSYYNGIPLGAMGTFGTFSFHETKNILCGEGGMLTVNDPSFSRRAEIIREKGTNRSAFFRSEVDKYGWVDIGSSFLPSEILAAILYAQLEEIDKIQQMRLTIWNKYYTGLAPIQHYGYSLPVIHSYSSNNAHLFYMLAPSLKDRDGLLEYLKLIGIRAVFHYQPLHNSKFYRHMKGSTIKELPNAVRYGNTLLRLPLYPSLSLTDQDKIVESILHYVRQHS